MSVASRTKKKEGGFGETVTVIIHALIIALVIRTFFFQPFNIPSGSMKTTLLVGDYLFVSKYTYGYSKYSLPLPTSLANALPDGRLPSGWGPQRGDVVVFRLPRDPSIDYIKRVIGLPGDSIQVKDGRVYINGKVVKREPAKPWVDVEEGTREQPVKRWKVTLPNGKSFYTLDLVDHGFADNTRRLSRAEGPLLHDGRQPRQLHRQPLPAGRLRAAREHRRQGAAHLLLGLSG